VPNRIAARNADATTSLKRGSESVVRAARPDVFIPNLIRPGGPPGPPDRNSSRLMMGFRVTARLSGGIVHLVGWVATQLSQGVALSKLGLDPAYHFSTTTAKRWIAPFSPGGRRWPKAG